MTISEKNDRGGRFGPFDPFARRGGPDKTMAAGESTSFAKEGAQGDLLTFKRTFRLNSPGDDTSFNIDGTGRWVFNTIVDSTKQGPRLAPSAHKQRFA